MNKKRIQFKQRKNTVVIRHEPNDEHEAWQNREIPTPATVPDAFFTWSEPLHPRTQETKSQKMPYTALSARQLRKRLYRAGLRGSKLADTLKHVLAGPGSDNVFRASWETDGLIELVGEQVARKLLRFVQCQMLILDEFGYYASSDMSRLFQQARSAKACPIVATQILEAIKPKPNNRKQVSFCQSPKQARTPKAKNLSDLGYTAEQASILLAVANASASLQATEGATGEGLGSARTFGEKLGAGCDILSLRENLFLAILCLTSYLLEGKPNGMYALQGNQGQEKRNSSQRSSALLLP